MTGLGLGQERMLSAQDMKAVYTKAITCNLCGCDRWLPIIRLLCNPIAGPKGGVIPQDAHPRCEQCGAMLGTAKPEVPLTSPLTSPSTSPLDCANQNPDHCTGYDLTDDSTKDTLPQAGVIMTPRAV